MKRYTQPSHWPDAHWCIPLVQFADENGKLPQGGQYVPQEVIDKMAAYENAWCEYSHFTPELAGFFNQVLEHITLRRFSEIMNAEMKGQLRIYQHGAHWEESKIPEEKWVCSSCGGACWYYEYTGTLGKSKFCPNCGEKLNT